VIVFINQQDECVAMKTAITGALGWFVNEIDHANKVGGCFAIRDTPLAAE
jgi:hypothetical protein